jgi:hypothetical protein
MATTNKTEAKLKTCVSCEAAYPAHSEFFATDIRNKPDMCADQCRFCTTQQAEKVSTRICRDCGESKTLPEFAKTPHGNDEYGRMQSCRDCWSGKISKARKRHERKRRRTPKEEAMAAAPTSPPKPKKKRRSKRAKGSSGRSHTKNRQQPQGAPDRKECSACLKEKTWKSFYADAKNDDRLMNRCIDCTLKKRKSRRPRIVGEHTRTLPNGDTIVINPGTSKTRRPAKAKPKAPTANKAPDLGIQSVTIDALLAEREAEIRADEREKVLAEIDSRYILVVKPE